MSEAFPSGDYKSWTICQVLFPHVKAVLAYWPAERKYLLYRSEVLHNAGWYATTQGDYFSAEETIRQALDEREKALGEEHLSTLMSVSNLALVLHHQGRYEEAEKNQFSSFFFPKGVYP